MRVSETKISYGPQNSLDQDIQKGYILEVSSPHKLENFHWYHELGPLWVYKAVASLRSGAVLYNGHFS